MIHRSQGRELLKSYLLGVASADEREAVEDEYLADHRSIKRLLRAEDDLIEDYARGALTAAERALFEKNFLRTAERRKRLAGVQELKQALSSVAGVSSATPQRDKASAPRTVGRPAPDYRQQPFHRLLAWLDPAPERAAEKYKNIHHRLVKLFASRGHVDAETLADETIDRVVRKVPELKDFRDVNPETYFYGVARMITLEHRKRGAAAPSLREAVIASAEPEGEGERAHECLDKCLSHLSADERDLFLSYYRFEGRNKAANRRHLAESLGISQNALRLRAHRMRVSMRNCVTSCLEQAKDAN
jgi:DNA-directed RNA polymerase specialized sigma24 family protein